MSKGRGCRRVAEMKNMEEEIWDDCKYREENDKRMRMKM